MKYSAFLTVAVLSAILTLSNSNNVTFGVLGPYNVLLYQRPILVSQSFFRVKEEEVFFPPEGRVNYHNLTAIRVIDHNSKGGGHAVLRNGGPFYPYAVIGLESERGGRLSYTVQFYG